LDFLNNSISAIPYACLFIDRVTSPKYKTPKTNFALYWWKPTKYSIFTCWSSKRPLE
jgi:hypothetical protein